ncbi:MAG: hypothetical protein ABI321_02935 [Polyangia bacterium]
MTLTPLRFVVLIVGLLCAATPCPADAPPKVVQVAEPPAFTLAELDEGIHAKGRNTYEIARPLVDRVLANTELLVRSVRLVPIQMDGAPSGFKLYAIRPASIFGRLGLQNGDLVRAINGRPFKSADDALLLYASLRRASELKIDIERASGRSSLTWRIRASK